MSVSVYLMELVERVLTLPSIVFTDAFFTVVGVIFFTGFFIRLLTRVVIGG